VRSYEVVGIATAMSDSESTDPDSIAETIEVSHLLRGLGS